MQHTFELLAPEPSCLAAAASAILRAAMLFNSVPFLALYLPITLLGFFWLGAPASRRRTSAPGASPHSC